MKGGSMDKYDDLQIALTAARDNLKSLNEKIGREQFRDIHRKRPHWDRDNGNGQHKVSDEHEKRSGHHRNDASHFQGGGGGGGVSGKRPRNNVFSRLEPRQQSNRGKPETRDPPPKPRLSSRVTKEVPRREDVVAAQSDEQSRARNKRMFGSLLGTLNKFCQDESRLRGRVEKKAIIEKKVEEQELREREMSKLERRNLFVDRKKKLMEVRLLEIKMERMQDLSTWEENQKKTREFIRTKAGPKIFFLPKVMHERTTKLLQESQQQYNEELAEKRETVQKELAGVEERLNRELERALEEKPSKEGEDGQKNEDTDHNDMDADGHSAGEDNGSEADEEDKDDQPRPRLVSEVVKSKVEVSIKNSQAERRHVLQSAINKKMIISVVNNAYEGGGGAGKRF